MMVRLVTFRTCQNIYVLLVVERLEQESCAQVIWMRDGCELVSVKLFVPDEVGTVSRVLLAARRRFRWPLRVELFLEEGTHGIFRCFLRPNA